jgi:hypothetical protein
MRTAAGRTWMLMRRRSDLQSRYVSVTDTGAGFELTFNPSQALTLGLLQREQEAHRRLAKFAKRAGAVKSRSKEGTSKAIIASLDRSDFSRRGIGPAKAHEALSIDGRRVAGGLRLRWTKDGRLKTSGSRSFTNGPQVIHFPLYHPHMIIELAKNPAEIASWRERDLANFAS